jgi:uncharacterized membrane protein
MSVVVPRLDLSLLSNARSEDLASPLELTHRSEDDSSQCLCRLADLNIAQPGLRADVCLAVKRATGEMIALRQIVLSSIGSKLAAASLQRKIEALKDLRHPHLVSYLGTECTEQHLR